MPPELIGQAYQYRTRYPRSGIYDLFALVLALARECPLLTGDNDLRQLAGLKGVEVFGALWLMERLYESRLLTLDEMAESYEAMLNPQRRLPIEEIKNHLPRLHGV